MGRAKSSNNTDALAGALVEFVSQASCCSYPQERALSAADKELLLTEKYQQLFGATRSVSPTWAFAFSAIQAAVAKIARDRH